MKDDVKNGDERRGSIRKPIELEVKYERLNTFFSDYTKNISKGGTFIKTERPLPVGTEFMFLLSLPVLEEPMRLWGKVQWVRGVDPGGVNPPDDEAGMGIRFVFANDQDRKTLEKSVEMLMIDSLGPVVYSQMVHSGASGDCGDTAETLRRIGVSVDNPEPSDGDG